MLFDIVGAILSVWVMVLFPLSKSAIWVGTIGTGLFIASMFATLLAFAGRRMVITGQVTGWFFVGSSLGAMTVPWVIGQLFERVGPQVMLVAVGVDLVVAFGIFMVLLLQARKMSLLTQVDSVSAPEMVS
jgi:fucose permease